MKRWGEITEHFYQIWPFSTYLEALCVSVAAGRIPDPGSEITDGPTRCFFGRLRFFPWVWVAAAHRDTDADLSGSPLLVLLMSEICWKCSVNYLCQSAGTVFSWRHCVVIMRVRVPLNNVLRTGSLESPLWGRMMLDSNKHGWFGFCESMNAVISAPHLSLQPWQQSSNLWRTVIYTVFAFIYCSKSNITDEWCPFFHVSQESLEYWLEVNQSNARQLANIIITRKLWWRWAGWATTELLY